jgi:hypothetical protein
MHQGERFLLLGGAGLTGRQIARRIATYLSPIKIIIASLFEYEVNEALAELKQSYADNAVQWEGEIGNVFVRSEFVHTARPELLNSTQNRDALYDDLFGSFEDAYQSSQLVRLILKHKPDVIVDTINTATAISYQDIDKASAVARRDFDALLAGNGSSDKSSAEISFEILLLSQALPQLVRHVQMLHRAMREANTRLYLKIGTTGTGGMGLNIPYTHSEDKPSAKLMTKTAVAFAHTGLMFLMARTPGSAIVKEIKPGAMIGYADVAHRPIMHKATGKTTGVFDNRSETLGGSLKLRDDASRYQRMADMTLPVVDTGENGLFTKGEFEAITSLRQMEFVTPEEIALEALLEIKGGNSGRDMIGAIDGAVMNPSYRAGYLRQQVLADMDRLEKETGAHSVALGQLGPPEISKLLWESELLKIEYGTFKAVLDCKPADIAEKLYARVQADPGLSHQITSIGVPILTPDGKMIIRGPHISIPEVKDSDEIAIKSADIDTWAAKGWVDLRAQNMKDWQERFQRMEASRQRMRGRGSAAVNREAYVFDDIRTGEIVGWIFNNEEDGYRIK